ncbi:ATPase [Alphaproteobacteria bacterium]|nr:ATPase [Alphaproteobacteria bacterium]
MIERTIQKHIEENLFRGKVMVIFGTRRVGKTTLVRQILNRYQTLGKRCAYFNCESFDVREKIETTNFQKIEAFLKPYDLIALDEAQYIETIGRSLKIMVDTHPEVQIIATGSSSFDIANKTGEPLVGRARHYTLYPFSLKEFSNEVITLSSNLEKFLRFGLYPTVISAIDPAEELRDIVGGYLYKDILAIEGMKSSKLLIDLLKLLALQLGSEVSYNELSNNLGIGISTVIKYIDLLERCFIVFTLPAFSRNLRNEVGRKSKKIYFYDLGVRNAIINAFAPLDMRADVGALWENFCIVELMKKAQNNRQFSNNYFWRTYDQQEVDFIEEYDGVLHAYEFKYSAKAKVKPPKLFLETYPSEFTVIIRDNWYEKLGK